MRKDNKEYNILVIEDNPGDFTLIQDYLEEQIANPHITHAINFREAKATLCELESQYDVVLLDLSLPDKRGELLISEIIASCPGCPVIALTGYSDIEFSVKSLALGVADYLLKDDINATSLYKSIVFNLERKKTNTALEESEKRYSDLFHLSPQPMWVYSLDSLKFQDVNKAAMQLYGYNRDEFLSMTIDDISLDAENGTPCTDLSEMGFQKVHDLQQSINHHKKNGDQIQVSLQANVVSFKGEKAEIIVATDITERNRYINEIRDQNKKLSEIAWMQSHVIRAPLAKIMGLVQLMSDTVTCDPDNEEIFGYLLDSAHELDNVIKEITDKSYLKK
jgi:PAS domain S-box-containing protein